MIPQNNSPLPKGSIGFLLGIAGMLCSLYFSIVFIAGNATGAELVVGVVFALIMDYSKLTLATEFMLSMVQFRLLSAVIYGLLVIALFGLSMLAATYTLASHSTDAIVQQSDSKVATIEKQIADKKQELAACNPNILTKCVNPRTAELTALQSQLTQAQNVSDDIIAAKNAAATWDKLAGSLGMPASELQVKLAFARAVLLEIISPLLVSLFLASYRSRFPTSAPVRPPAQHIERIEVETPAPSERIEPAPVPERLEKKQ